MYDAIVVGARCAGSPTAMLLARRGYRVLLVDRARFPSDTISTHYLQPTGIDRLAEWGLLDALVRTGCPPLPRVRFEFEDAQLDGRVPRIGSADAAYGPRRYVLDALLLNAAQDAGAEVRLGCSIVDTIRRAGCVAGVRLARPGRSDDHALARIVVGADGRNSTIAKRVGARAYVLHPALTCTYYGYWPIETPAAIQIHVRSGRVATAMPTHHGLSLISMAWPRAQFAEIRRDRLRRLRADLEVTAPSLLDAIGSRSPVERIVGTADLPSFYRQSYGPGWALVGDAGAHTDPTSAFGMTHAFIQAELLSDAIHAGLSGQLPLDEALASYQRERDRTVEHAFQAGLQNAQYSVPQDVMEMLRSMQGDQAAIDRFVGFNAGVLPSPQA